MSHANSRFARYAWAVLGYNLLVILWGAWVRVTGSGAGCGDHWPTCHGEVIPRSPSAETIIEYIHRVTSGLTLPLALVLVGWAFKTFPKGHRARPGSIVALVFLLAEAAVGAGLVKFELVAENASVERAIVIAVHLVNTFALVGAGALTAWWGGGGRRLGPADGATRGLVRLLWIGVALLCLTGLSGAITALGDTLFPPDVTAGAGLWARIQADLSPTMHFLVRLRIIHPLVAVVTALFLLSVLVPVVSNPDHHESIRRWARAAIALTAIQVAAGLVNVLLHAPGWMQLLHLLLSDLLWISVVLLLAAVRPRAEAPAATPSAYPEPVPADS